MFKKIGDMVTFPHWAKKDPRYINLDLCCRLLDGTFYDHLKYAFYDETDPNGGPNARIIPLAERRPSAQFRLPRMVARWSARKLFAGRHRPKLKLDEATTSTVLAPLAKVLRQARFVQTMSNAVLNGSVGSVAVTFRVRKAGDNQQAAFQIWRAQYCKPSFDQFGDLAQLRINYTCTGADFIALGASKTDVEASAIYWFIRDYMPDKEITYKPVKKDDWNPVEGFTNVDGKGPKELTPWDEMSHDHAFGFVPGHWFVNLSGGAAPDGACTFADAIPNSIELDYTLSQTGRGIRYNSAPQLVTIGQVLNGEGFTRSPVTHLAMRGGYKEDDQQYAPGDAKLLEMSGSGSTAALAYIDHLRNFALEQISASRKDPDKMKAPLSGRAMEYLDQDSDDLIMDLRGQYGDDGALPLLRKLAAATKTLTDKEAGALTMQWPRLAQPTPDEVLALAQAFQLMLDPLKKTAPGQPAKPGKPAGENSPATPGTPEVPPVDVGEDEQLITMDQARAYISLNLDLAMLETESAEQAERVDDSPTSPDEPTPPVPAPLSIDEPDIVGDNAPANQPGHVAGHAAPMHVGAPARVNA
jgi:hypothetical protein